MIKKINKPKVNNKIQRILSFTMAFVILLLEFSGNVKVVNAVPNTTKDLERVLDFLSTCKYPVAGSTEGNFKVDSDTIKKELRNIKGNNNGANEAFTEKKIKDERVKEYNKTTAKLVEMFDVAEKDYIKNLEEFKTEYDKAASEIKQSKSTSNDSDIANEIANNENEKYSKVINLAIALNIDALTAKTAFGLYKDSALSNSTREGFSEKYRWRVPSISPAEKSYVEMSNKYKNSKMSKDTSTNNLMKALSEKYKTDNAQTKTSGWNNGLSLGKLSTTAAPLLGESSNEIKKLSSLMEKLTSTNHLTGGGTINEDQKTNVQSEDPSEQKKINEERKKAAESIKDDPRPTKTPGSAAALIQSKGKDLAERNDLYEQLGKLAGVYASIKGHKNVDSKSMNEIANNIKAIVDQNRKDLEMLQQAASGQDPNDPNAAGPGKIKDLPTSYLQIMPDIFDEETKQLNKTFLQLFANTANYTPFVTNVYDSDITSSMTDKEKELYKKYSSRRSIVYMAVGDKGIAKGIRMGSPYQYKPISLAEFIDKADTSEMLLFARAQKIAVTTEENEDGKEQEKVITATASDAEEVTQNNSEETVEKNAQDLTEAQKKAAISEGKNVKEMYSIPWKLVNGSVSDPNIDIDENESISFVGPVFASSGTSYKEPHSLDDLGSSRINILLDKTKPKDMIKDVADPEDKITKDGMEESKPDDADKPGENKSDGDSRLKPEVEDNVEVTAYSINGNTASGEKTKVGTLAVSSFRGMNYEQLKDRIVWIDGYGYGIVKDKMKNKSASFDVWLENESDAKKFGRQNRNVKLMPKGFEPKELGNPAVATSSTSNAIPGSQNEGSQTISNPQDIDQDSLQKVKESILEGVDEERLEDASIARYTGNTMNMNYFLLHNNLMSRHQYSTALKEDMNKPLYLDFLGNILTNSGYVVVPAAANFNYYNSTLDLPMFNASFLNSYPDLVLDETQQYVNTNSLEKKKFIYEKNKQGLVTIAKLSKDGNSQNQQFYAVPFVSRSVTKEGGKTINLMDDITMFKDNVIGYAKSRDIEDDSNNKVFVNLGAILQKYNFGEGGNDNVINLKKVSTIGSGLDWQVLKRMNYNHIDVEKSSILNQELLASNAITSELSVDGRKGQILTDYVSKDEQLRSKNSLIKVIGEVFESLTLRVFSQLPTNYVLFTPSVDSIPFMKNAGRYSQKYIFIISILAFIFYVIRFIWSIFTRNDFNLKSVFLSMVLIALIGSSSLFIIPGIINILYNKPRNMIMKNEIPMYVLDGMEQGYREENPMFFDSTGYSEVESNPSITIDVLKPRDAEYVRNEVLQTPVQKTAFFIPNLDSAKVPVLGDKIYLQGRDLKIDVKDLFNITRIDDKPKADGTIKLEFNYTGYGQLTNYMPYMPIADSLTDRINDFNTQTMAPYRVIQYKKGLAKSTGRTEDFIKSIAFIAPDLLDYFINDLQKEYLNNMKTFGDYYNDYTRPDELAESDLKVNDVDGTDAPGDGSGQITDKQDKDVSFDDVARKMKENQTNKNSYGQYVDPVIMRSAMEYLKSNQSKYVHDWLGLSRVIGLEKDNNLFPDNEYSSMKNTKWFPQWQEQSIPKNRWEEEMVKKIDLINENTREFVVKKLIPISGNISDDTAIKIISLYATMEYNREFSDSVDAKLYPKYYNPEDISNLYVSKSTLIPQSEIYLTGVNKTGLYLARETGVIGLLLSTIMNVAMYIRMIIRIALLSFVIITLPFVLLYVYAIRQNRYSKYLFGSMSAVFIFAILYWVELYWYKLSAYMTNKIGTMESLSIGIIPVLLITSIYVKLLWVILSDIRNFGFGRLQDKFTGILAGYYGVDMNDAYNMAATNYGYNYGYDNTSELGNNSGYSGSPARSDFGNDVNISTVSGNEVFGEGNSGFSNVSNLGNTSQSTEYIENSSENEDKKINKEDIVLPSDIIGENEVNKDTLMDDMEKFSRNYEEANENKPDRYGFNDRKENIRGGFENTESDKKDSKEDKNISDKFIEPKIYSESPDSGIIKTPQAPIRFTEKENDELMKVKETDLQKEIKNMNKEDFDNYNELSKPVKKDDGFKFDEKPDFMN